MENFSKNKSLTDLLDFIQFLENTSASIHRVDSEKAVFEKLMEAFSLSKSYSATIFLLNTGKDKLIVSYTSIPSKMVKIGEKIAGIKLIGCEFQLTSQGLWHQPLDKLQTVEITMKDILIEVMPKPLAGAVQIATGYANRRVLLTPLTKRGQSIGVLVVSAVGLSSYLEPSFKNLAYHVSTALERADENLKLQQSQRDLKESERTARVLLDTPSDVIFLIDPVGILLDLNTTLSKRHQMAREQLIGKNVFDLIPKKIAAERLQKLKQVIHNCKPVRFQDENNGIWSDITIHPILKENGEVEKIAVFSHEITDLKLAEARLTEAHSKLEGQARKVSLTNEELKLLSKTAADFSEIDTSRDIFPLIGKNLSKFSRGALVAVVEFDQDSHSIILRDIGKNPHHIKVVVDILGFNPIGKKYCISEQLIKNMGKSGLKEVKEGFPGLAPEIPNAVSSAFVNRFKISKVYLMGFTRQGRLYGGALLLMRKGSSLKMPQIIQTFSHQASVALQRWKLEKQLEKSRKDLRKLAMYLQSAREEERMHVAREIHDDLGQTLTAFKIDLAWLGGKLQNSENTVKDKLASMQNLVGSAITTVKRISSDLRPGPLADLGLRAAMEWQIGEFAKRTGIRCLVNLKSKLAPIPLNEKSKIALFRIFQETLTNILRHSKATEVKVSSNIARNNLYLSIEDNGLGISEDQLTADTSYGILGIKERVDALNGKVKFDGKPGTGTSVSIRVPLCKGGGS